MGGEQRGENLLRLEHASVPDLAARFGAAVQQSVANADEASRAAAARAQTEIASGKQLLVGIAVVGMLIAIAIAWLYVGLRIVHSLVQATVNIVVLRFAIFMVASLVLLAMTLRAAVAVL